MINFIFPFKWQDEDAFFTDYAASHKKLSELGFTPPSSGLMGAAKSSKILALIVGAVAVAVVILSYFYEISQKNQVNKT
jgi:L-ascorbate peroxidase